MTFGFLIVVSAVSAAAPGKVVELGEVPPPDPIKRVRQPPELNTCRDAGMIVAGTTMCSGLALSGFAAIDDTLSRETRGGCLTTGVVLAGTGLLGMLFTGLLSGELDLSDVDGKAVYEAAKVAGDGMVARAQDQAEEREEQNRIKRALKEADERAIRRQDDRIEQRGSKQDAETYKRGAPLETQARVLGDAPPARVLQSRKRSARERLRGLRASKTESPDTEGTTSKTRSHRQWCEVARRNYATLREQPIEGGQLTTLASTLEEIAELRSSGASVRDLAPQLRQIIDRAEELERAVGTILSEEKRRVEELPPAASEIQTKFASQHRELVNDQRLHEFFVLKRAYREDWGREWTGAGTLRRDAQSLRNLGSALGRIRGQPLTGRYLQHCQ